jgi:hypothetical protein
MKKILLGLLLISTSVSFIVLGYLLYSFVMVLQTL